MDSTLLLRKELRGRGLLGTFRALQNRLNRLRCVWDADLGGSKEPRIMDHGGLNPQGEGAALEEKWRPIVKYRDTVVSCA